MRGSHLDNLSFGKNIDPHHPASKAHEVDSGSYSLFVQQQPISLQVTNDEAMTLQVNSKSEMLKQENPISFGPYSQRLQNLESNQKHLLLPQSNLGNYTGQQQLLQHTSLTQTQS